MQQSQVSYLLFIFIPISKSSIKTMKINQLTHAEELLMNILWKLNSAYMKDVMEEYPEPKPHQNTVSTFIKILVEKEFLTTEKEGRIFKYHVAIPFEDYRIFRTKNFVEQYFGNSGSELIKTLVDAKLLNPSELTNLFGTKTLEQENPISDFVEEITSGKKTDKKDKKKKKKDKKKK